MKRGQEFPATHLTSRPGEVTNRKNSPMIHPTLGNQELTVSTVGLGGMGMSEFHGSRDDRESIATIHRALGLGVTLFGPAGMDLEE
jgi:hypothetical protein